MICIPVHTLVAGIFFATALFTPLPASSGDAPPAGEAIHSGLPQGISAVYDLGKVWSGTTPSFYALKSGNIVYVAYYAPNLQMTLARLDLTTGGRIVQGLNNFYGGWDSHNYLTMALDKWNNLHLAGDMKTTPLVYGRTLIPGDFNSFRLINKMVGENEDVTAYPNFLNSPSGDLLFWHRSGISQNSSNFIDSWNGSTWKRLLSTPLTAALNANDLASAYGTSFVPGPDGWFHYAWTWRRNPDAATNFNINYAKSKDFVHWYNWRGTPLQLPITPESDTVVDAVPVHGGVFNWFALSFDAKDRPIISYTKYDGNSAIPAPDCSTDPADEECGAKKVGSPVPAYIVPGATQIFNARLEDGIWQIHQATHWTARWNFGGLGSISNKVGFTEVTLASDGHLQQSLTHSVGSDPATSNGTFELDANSLEAVRRTGSFNKNAYPPIMTTLRSKQPYYKVIIVPVHEQTGLKVKPSTRYFLRWEAQQNMCRDHQPSPANCPGLNPLPSTHPEPSDLQLYEVSNAQPKSN